jgi:hypothetical protein
VKNKCKANKIKQWRLASVGGQAKYYFRDSFMITFIKIIFFQTMKSNIFLAILFLLQVNSLCFSQTKTNDSIISIVSTQDDLQTTIGRLIYFNENFKRIDSLKKVNISRYVKELDLSIAKRKGESKKHVIRDKKDYLKLVEIMETQRKKINKIYLNTLFPSNENDIERLIWLYDYTRFEITSCINFEKYQAADEKYIDIEGKY